MRRSTLLANGTFAGLTLEAVRPVLARSRLQVAERHDQPLLFLSTVDPAIVAHEMDTVVFRVAAGRTGAWPLPGGAGAWRQPATAHTPEWLSRIDLSTCEDGTSCY